MSVEPPWTGMRSSFRPDGVDTDTWLNLLGEGRIEGVTLRGVVAVAVAETLHQFFDPDRRAGRQLPWELTKTQDHVCRSVWVGRMLPKYDEADMMLRTPETAPLLGNRLLVGIVRYLDQLPVAPGVTRVATQAELMPQLSLFQSAPAIDRDGTSAAALHLIHLLMGPEVNPGHAAEAPGGGFLLGEGAGAVRVTPQTHRDMVRAVIPANRTPITSRAIRDDVVAKFGSQAPSAAQITQAILGLQRDGELVALRHGVQAATKHFGHPPRPRNPKKSSARKPKRPRK